VTAALPALPMRRTDPAIDHSFLDRKTDPVTTSSAMPAAAGSTPNPIPADESGWGVDSQASLENRDKLASSWKSRGPADARNQKIGDLYASCMDEGAAEKKLGIEPLQPMLARSTP